MPDIEGTEEMSTGMPALRRPRAAGPDLPDGKKPRQRVWWKRLKVLPAFWTIACVFSLVVNIILVALLIGLARDIFTIKNMVSEQLIGGLYQNFQKMDDSHIVTTITVSDTLTVKDTIPVVFTLPLKEETVVTLVGDTPLNNATIYLNGAPVPLNLILPKGTKLGINLDLEVPVNQVVPIELKVPISMQVPVDIALEQTDLHVAFSGLIDVVGPYYQISSDLPSTWEDVAFCGPATNWFCRWFFSQE